MTTRKESITELRVRDRDATFIDRIRTLDEFVPLTSSRGKHAIRAVHEEIISNRAAHVPTRLYDAAVRQALTMIWEAADRDCGKAPEGVDSDGGRRHGTTRPSRPGSGRQDQGFTRGAPIWGRDAALKRFEVLCQGTWKLSPDTANFKAVLVSDMTAQIHVPITYGIGPPGQP